MKNLDTIKSFSTRTFILNFFSLIFSLGFIAYTFTLVILLKSLWYLFMAIYYMILLGMRFAVLNIAYKSRKSSEEAVYPYYLSIYKFFGIIFISLILFFGFTFLSGLKIYQEIQLSTSLFIFSIYAILKFIFAIYNFIKAIKNRHILVKILRNLSLIDALMTLAIFQAVVAEYSAAINPEIALLHDLLQIGIGAFICLVTVSMGIWMIIEAKVKGKKFRNKQ